MNGYNSVRRGQILEVPYKDKDQAKLLGARWDPDLRKWFVPLGQDTQPFERWVSKDLEVRTKTVSGVS